MVPSAMSFRANLVGLFCFLFATYALVGQSEIPIHVRILVILAIYAVPIVLIESLYLQHYRLLPRVEWARVDLRRAFTKLVGLYATLLVVAFAYWVFPEYHGAFYRPYWDLLWLTLPFVVVLAIPYLIVMDAVAEQPFDPYYRIGRLLVVWERPPADPQLLQHFLGWVVKAFFFPLMTVYFITNLNSLGQYDTAVIVKTAVAFARDLGTNSAALAISQEFRPLFDLVWSVCMYVDTGVACLGYALTLRWLDAQIRSTEPTTSGWLVALVCYQPFWSILSANYLAYNAEELNWGDWLWGWDFTYLAWGLAILFLMTVYSLATVAFGIRFSNLTHRGIVTDGPYRYTKHPAYLAKTLSWWFVSVPFVVGNTPPGDVVRNIVMLAGLTVIYYARAKTEERHLRRDPVYCEYARWVDAHGLLARLWRGLAGLLAGLAKAARREI
jgi:protein-S-isoprenylcysteine O-methyltransferase Ste14